MHSFSVVVLIELSHFEPWRLPYSLDHHQKELKTFIYSFTWEDPEVDMQHLDLSPSDSMFVITSAGDNPLHYSIASSPRNIHCVDMNPCQGHLLELKLGAIKSLEFSDFFALFGRGYHPHFRKLLDTKIGCHLSRSAYRFWTRNADSFSSSLYEHGYSGWALRLARFLFRVAGVREDVERLCNCDSLEEQISIWRSKLRSVWLNPVVVALLQSPVFCWNALGVPLNQRKMLLDEGGVYQYVCDTLEPVLSSYLLKTCNYFYLLCLLGHYTPECCPFYLTREGFNKLKANNSSRLNAFQLHTDSIVNVLRGLTSSSLTRALVMDHLDWYDPGSSEAKDEIVELFRAIAPGGLVFWRSASRYPWYNDLFVETGFHVEAVGVRKQGSDIALDRVNMYASFWKAIKPVEYGTRAVC
ncbi:hypothetical protein BT96DRAFT_839753 [Gymnopus androsaceus JB14]|uniref:S-adenosyl-L-methionine-dependent methyltransferase n=1 Tax=Gymnopus androsaceus JB14 TaxID=1447944 RepID=A0A6A4GLD7_9AGAR|nr:hypothetical protein BT96DRAFT_839753 [Gymnopus androsaceus JB14]